MATAYQTAPDGFEVVPSDFWGSPVWRDRQTKALMCPGYTGATYATNVNDTMFIGGMQTPGICDVVPDKGRAVDKSRKAAGADGSKITLHGIQNGEVTISIKVWTPDQWEALKALWLVIFPGTQKVTTTKKTTTQVPVEQFQSTTSGAASSTQFKNVTTITKKTQNAQPTPWTCIHPFLALHKITSLMFLSANGPVPNARGLMVFTIKAVEFAKPNGLNVTSTPKAVEAKGSVLEPASNPPPGFGPVEL